MFYCVRLSLVGHRSDACQLFQAFDKSFPFEKSLGKVNIDYDKSPWMTQGRDKKSTL